MVEDTGVKRLIYLHDYGHGWEHTIRIERIVAALPGELYPRLLDASGRRPPEDIGGLRGMPSSSKPWPIRTMLATLNSRNGTTPTSIRTPGNPTAPRRFGETLVTVQAKTAESSLSGIVR